MTKKVIFPILLLLISAQVSAQTKVGTFDTDYVLAKMPEFKKVQEDLKAYGTKLEADLKVKTDEYQAKIKSYQEGVANMTDPMKKLKQDSLYFPRKKIELMNSTSAFYQSLTSTSSCGRW